MESKGAEREKMRELREKIKRVGKLIETGKGGRRRRGLA